MYDDNPMLLQPKTIIESASRDRYFRRAVWEAGKGILYRELWMPDEFSIQKL